MGRLTFLDKDILTKCLILLVVLFVLGFFKTAFLFIFIFVSILFLFRKKDINLFELRGIGRNIVLSSFTGTVTELKNTEKDVFSLSCYIKLLDGYGLYFPTVAEVEDVKESKENIKFFGFFKLLSL